jgi:eukaryotic-like serine/threonine-protein kinase
VHAVVFDIQPQLEGIPATLPLRKTLIEQTLVYLEAVSRDVGHNVSLLRELANSYAQLAIVQGDAFASNLGDRQAAARYLAAAAALMDRALGLTPRDRGLLADASALNRRRADFALQGDDRASALGFADAAVDLAERALAIDAGDPIAREARALAWLSLGRIQMSENLDAALASFERARSYFGSRAQAGAAPLRETGLIELYTADVLIRQRHTDRAPHHAREALRVANHLLAERPGDQRAQLDVAMAAGQLASVLYNAGDHAGAVGYFRESAEMRERMVAGDPGNVRLRERLGMAKGRLGTILARAGEYRDARVMLDRAVSLYEELQAAGQLAPNMEPDFAEVLGHLGDYHLRTAAPQDACAAFRRAAALLAAADARAPLTPFRKEMLAFNLGQLEQCRS